MTSNSLSWVLDCFSVVSVDSRFASQSRLNPSACRVFPRRLTIGEIFNNRLLFENNGLLFSLLFSGNFYRRDKALMEGDNVRLPLLKSLLMLN